MKVQPKIQTESERWEHLHRLFEEIAIAQRETDRLLKAQVEKWEREHERRCQEDERRKQEAKEQEEKRRQEVEEQEKKREQEARKQERKWKELAEEQERKDKLWERALDKRYNKLENLFTSQWGRLVESLVEGDLVPILNSRGIEVRHTEQRVKGRRNGDHFEFDIIAVDGIKIVIVEVKTTLRPKHVRHFLQKLDRAKEYTPQYKNHIVLGAMAWLRVEAEADVMAERQGLFVIRATGKSASIVNSGNFTPRSW